MKKSRYSEEQIIGILKEHEAGMKTAELCRKHNIGAGTFYQWKAKFGGLDVNDAKKLRHLEQETPDCRSSRPRSRRIPVSAW
jgi:putative transposase